MFTFCLNVDIFRLKISEFYVKIKIMNSVFYKNGISLTEEKINKFKNFYEFLSEENKKYNLTAIKEENDVYLKHFADSLKGAEFFNSGEKTLELGSGAGFPSVPLKINDENINLTLIEATSKKCAFLRAASEKLGFKNFNVLCGRAEILAKNADYREQFDVVTARALARLNELLELAVPFLKPNGKLVLYKNYSLSEINEAASALKTLNCEITEIKKYVLISDEIKNGENFKKAITSESLNENKGERAIIIIKKYKTTPEKYPREYKQIIKKPL